MIWATLLLGLSTAATADNWVSITSPNFRIVSNAGENRAREVAREFEQIRTIFRNAMTAMKRDSGVPILIYAVKDDASLRELLPEFWEQEGPKPSGVFRRSAESHFIVARTDATRESRYRTIYHEYFHSLVSSNQGHVPVWVNEGLAEFWEQTRMRGGRVETGTPNESHLHRLEQTDWMPLDELLAMGENPHLSDPESVNLFYAQAWALTHFLMMAEPASAPGEKLGSYIDDVSGGANSREAFVRHFGPLDAVESQLRSYVRRHRLRAMQMNAPEKIDSKAFAAEKLSEAQTLALRGYFLVSGPRANAGVPLLEKSLALSEHEALALEAMGFYHFRRGDRAEAATWFARAIERDSTNYLCHYYGARLSQAAGEDDEGVADGLRRTLELNPRFAPAHAELSTLYAQTGQDLERAYAHAGTAVELAPDNAWYWVSAGQILVRMNRLTDARAAAARARLAARKDSELLMVKRLLQQLELFERLQSVPKD